MAETTAPVEPELLGGGAPLELLDHVGCGIWVYDGDAVLYVNHALEEVTGFSRAELLSPGFFERLIHPDDREMIVERGRARIRGEDVPEKYEVQILAKDGDVRVLSVHGRRVRLDDTDVSVVSTVDVTPLREAQRTIREGTTQLLTLLNSVPAHIITTNAEGRPTFVNSHWLEFTGQSREEAMANGTAPLIHPDDMRTATRSWMAALRSGQGYEIEYRVRDRQGEYRWQSFRIRPLLTEGGETSGWAAVAVDVHENKQLRDELGEAVEQLADAMAAKDEVLGLISHELRTPLTTLLGNAAYLQRNVGGLDPDTRQAIVADLAADSQRLYVVIENMLVLSRLGANERIETEPARLNRLAEMAAKDFQKRAPSRPIEVDVPAAVSLVLVNPNYYRQVVGNLLSNADKYSPAGLSITVRVDEAEGALETSVIDQGAGIPPEDVDRVFAPFFRSSNHSSFTGVGLGLTVCQRLVELQGGSIRVRNLEAGGCCFSFTIPIAQLPSGEEG